jgi:hypothetical protein
MYEIAQAGDEAAFPLGCAFRFFLGPPNRKINFKKLGFRLGSDLVILSCCAPAAAGEIA